MLKIVIDCGGEVRGLSASVHKATAVLAARAPKKLHPAIETFPQPQNSYYFYRGRTALNVLLRALGVQAGDEVIVQAYTCLAVILPIMSLGAIPVYVDIMRGTYTVDPAAVAARITARTRVLIIQHTFGIPADLTPLLEIAKEHRLSVIEDCCHVHGSTYDGQPLGSFGVGAFYSFHWSKPLAAGRGGLAVANEPLIARRVASLHASFSQPSMSEVAILNAQYLAFKVLRGSRFITHLRRLLRFWSPMGVASGQFKRAELEYKATDDYTKKMAGVTAHQVRSMLRNGRMSIERRQHIGQQLHTHATQLGVSPLGLLSNSCAVFSCYPLRTGQREQVIRESWSWGVNIAPGFVSPVDPISRGGWVNVGYRAGSCPVAEELSEKTITLPVNDWARNSDVHGMLEFVDAMKAQGLLEIVHHG